MAGYIYYVHRTLKNKTTYKVGATEEDDTFGAPYSNDIKRRFKLGGIYYVRDIQSAIDEVYGILGDVNYPNVPLASFQCKPDLDPFYISDVITRVMLKYNE